MWAATGKNSVYDFSGIFGESPKIPEGTGRGRGQPYGQEFLGENPQKSPKNHKHYSSQSLLTSSKAFVSEGAVQIQVQTISINWTAELDCAHYCTSFYKTKSIQD